MAMRMPTGESGVGSGLRWASARSALSRAVLRVFTRRSTGARSASALPSSAAKAPKLASSCGASHSGKSPTTCAGASVRSAAVSRACSPSVRFAGAWPSPENTAATARARKTVRQAPIFHRVGRGSATGFDIRQNFDRGGGAGGGGHEIEEAYGGGNRRLFDAAYCGADIRRIRRRPIGAALVKRQPRLRNLKIACKTKENAAFFNRGDG